MKRILAIIILIVSLSVPVYATGYYGYMGPGMSQGIEQGGNALAYGIMERRTYEQQRQDLIERQNYVDKNIRRMEQEGSVLNFNPTAHPEKRIQP